MLEYLISQYIQIQTCKLLDILDVIIWCLLIIIISSRPVIA